MGKSYGTGELWPREWPNTVEKLGQATSPILGTALSEKVIPVDFEVFCQIVASSYP